MKPGLPVPSMKVTEPRTNERKMLNADWLSVIYLRGDWLSAADECITPRVSMPPRQWRRRGPSRHTGPSMKVTEPRTNESKMLNAD